jgi:hypothetical protein
MWQAVFTDDDAAVALRAVHKVTREIAQLLELGETTGQFEEVLELGVPLTTTQRTLLLLDDRCRLSGVQVRLRACR